MTKKTSNSVPQQYITAAIRRQHVLDILHANPGAKLCELQRMFEQLTGESCSIDNSIRVMVDSGEVRAVGPRGKRSYFAVATVTLSPEAMASKRRETLRDKANDQHNQPATRNKTKPGHYVHAPGHYDNVPGHEQGKPLRHQGGQGGLKARVYAGIVGTLI